MHEIHMNNDTKRRASPHLTQNKEEVSCVYQSNTNKVKEKIKKDSTLLTLSTIFGSCACVRVKWNKVCFDASHNDDRKPKT